MLSHIDLDTLTETLEFEPNEDLLFSFNLYEDGGINNIEHIGLYLNNYGSELKVADYDTSIVFDKYSPEQVVLTDPNELIKSYDFKIREIDAYNFKILYSFTFTQPLDVTNFYVTVWDLDKNPSYKTFEDVLKIDVPGDLHNVSISEEEIIIESDEAEIINVDVNSSPIISDGDQSNGFAGILKPDDYEKPKFDTVPEKHVESIIKPKTVCGDGSILKNGICVLDITKQESIKSNTNTLSILVGIFILEAILSIFLIILFRKKRRKEDPEIPKYPLKLDK